MTPGAFVEDRIFDVFGPYKARNTAQVLRNLDLFSKGPNTKERGGLYATNQLTMNQGCLLLLSIVGGLTKRNAIERLKDFVLLEDIEGNSFLGNFFQLMKNDPSKGERVNGHVYIHHNCRFATLEEQIMKDGKLTHSKYVDYATDRKLFDNPIQHGFGFGVFINPGFLAYYRDKLRQTRPTSENFKWFSGPDNEEKSKVWLKERIAKDASLKREIMKDNPTTKKIQEVVFYSDLPSVNEIRKAIGMEEMV